MQMTNQIREYFGCFGEVKSMEIIPKKNVQCGLIEFKMAETAETVLSTKEHRIGDCDVEVIAAEPCHQPGHILNALYDDCLQMMLSNLNLIDLTNAANVCVRFNHQAKVVFSSKYHNKLDLSKWSLDQTKTAIQTFGPLAHSIDIIGFPADVTIGESEYNHFIWGPENNSEILSMVDAFCTSKLRELKFIEFHFEGDTFYDKVIVDSAFKTLENITFYESRLICNARSLLALCSELKELKFDRCSLLHNGICTIKFNKLEKFQLIKTKSLGDGEFKRFIVLNPSLTKLSFIGLPSRFISTAKTLQSIATNLPHLVELEFQHCDYGTDFGKYLKHFGKLTSLKVLKFDLIAVTAKQLADSLTANDAPIEQLRLNYGKIDDDALNSISHMKQLKILELCYTENFTDENLIELAKRLGHQLEKLELEKSTAEKLTTIGLKKMLPFAVKLAVLILTSPTIEIDANDYSTMLNQVEKRPEKCNLLLKLFGEGNQVHVPEESRLKHRDTFHIQQISDASEFNDYDDLIPTASEDSESDDPYYFDYSYDSDDYYQNGYFLDSD